MDETLSAGVETVKQIGPGAAEFAIAVTSLEASPKKATTGSLSSQACGVVVKHFGADLR